MTLMNLRSFIPTAAAVLAVGLFSYLGFWQLDRAGEKERRLRAFDARGDDAPISLNRPMPVGTDPDWLRYRRVEVEGRAIGGRQYLLDNRTLHGVAGYHVHLPVLVAGLDRVVLVNRGWVEVGPSRERRPDVSLGDSNLMVSGIVDHPRQTLLLGDDGYADSSWPKVVQRIDLDKTARDLGQPALPFVVLMDAAQPRGFVREWRPFLGIGPLRHRGYALQWFSLAATVVIVWIVVNVRSAARR